MYRMMENIWLIAMVVIDVVVAWCMISDILYRLSDGRTAVGRENPVIMGALICGIIVTIMLLAVMIV